MNQSLVGWSEYYGHSASARRFRKVQGYAYRRVPRRLLYLDASVLSSSRRYPAVSSFGDIASQ